MKYLKLQQDLLKAADARDGWKHKFFDYPYFVDNNGDLWVCPKGLYIIKIAHRHRYIDVSMVFDAPSIRADKILDDSNATDAVYTHKITITDNKMKLHTFMVGDEVVYLDEDLLRYFDLENSTFKGTNRKSPIFIYEDEELVGVVLSVNHIEKEDDDAGN